MNSANMRNLGGTMPDGSRAQDLWINQSDFICESGAMLSQSLFKNILGKLCLTKMSLVMLPYEGTAVEIAIKLADYLKKTMLGPSADMAKMLEKFGFYAKGPELLDKILMWPLANINQDTRAEEKSFLFIHGGADLIVSVKDQVYNFNMASKGYEYTGFASAQEFRDQINKLRHT